MSNDIQELEASLRQQEVVREQETPAEEIARLKEASMDDHINMDREVTCLPEAPFTRASNPDSQDFIQKRGNTKACIY